MERKFLAVVTGMITAVAIIWVGWMISTMLGFTTPKNLEYISNQDIQSYPRNMPTSAYVCGILFYAVAAFSGGYIATKVGRRWSEGNTLAIVVGGLLSLGSLLSALTWSQPIWFVIVAVLMFIPISLIGYRFAR